jgi:hypothetical protein
MLTKSNPIIPTINIEQRMKPRENPLVSSGSLGIIEGLISLPGVFGLYEDLTVPDYHRRPLAVECPCQSLK